MSSGRGTVEQVTTMHRVQHSTYTRVEVKMALRVLKRLASTRLEHFYQLEEEYVRV